MAIGPITPPTKVQRNVSGAVSLAVAAAAGTTVAGLAASWHFPGLPSTGGPVTTHMGFWLSCGANHLMPLHYFSERCGVYHNFLDAVTEGQAWGLGLRVGLSVFAGLAVGAYTLSRGLIPSDSLMHSRGFRLIKGRDAIRRARVFCEAEIQRAQRPCSDGRDLLFHPDVCFAPEKWAKHVMVIGAIGAGKTVFLLHLIRQILARDDRVLLFDIKRDFTMYFKNAIIVAATDQRSWAWDIARDLQGPNDPKRFAEILIPESKDPFWSNAAQVLLIGYIKKLTYDKGINWGFPELRDIFATPDSELRKIMEDFSPAGVAAFDEIKEREAASSQTTKSIKMTMQTYCAAIYDLATAWEHVPPHKRFSAVEWITNPETRHRQVILQGDKTANSLTRAYISQIYGVACSRIGELPEARKVPPRKDGKSNAIWLFCDELPALGKIEAFDDAITLGRSKDVRWIAGLQALEQLDDVYGEKKANTWISNMGTHVIGRVAPGTTATRIKDLIGKREVERPNLSISDGASGKGSTFMTSRDEMNVVFESELSQDLGPQTVPDAGFFRRCYETVWPFAKKKEKTVIRMLTLGLNDTLVMDWPITNLESRRRAFVPADWLSAPPKPRVRVTDADFVPQDELEGGLDGPDEEQMRVEATPEPSEEEYAALIQQTADAAERAARDILARAEHGQGWRADARRSGTTAARIFVPGVDTGERVGGLQPDERQGEFERQSIRDRLRQTVHERAAGLSISRATSSGLTIAPDPASTTAARIGSFTTDPSLRPGLDGRDDDDLSETAHATHEVAEAIGHTAHLDAGQTEHLSQALLALDVIDSLAQGDSGGGAPAQQVAQQRGARSALVRQPGRIR